MAFRKRSTRSKRPMRRMRPKRKTYRKKRSFANNKTVAKISTSLIPRTLYVKLPVAYSFNMTLDPAEVGSSPWTTFNINGNNIATPFTEISGSDVINTLGAPLPMGLARYAQFYRSVRTLGAKCTIQVANVTASGTSANIPTIALTAYQGRMTPSLSLEYLNNYYRINSTDNDSFRAWPNTKFVRLGTRDSSAGYRTLSMFQKTKSILGVKDVRDEDSLSQTVDFDGALGPNAYLLAEDDSWSFMIRAMLDDVVVGSQPAIVIQVLARLTYYVELHDRKFEPQILATAGLEE